MARESRDNIETRMMLYVMERRPTHKCKNVDSRWSHHAHSLRILLKNLMLFNLQTFRTLNSLLSNSVFVFSKDCQWRIKWMRSNEDDIFKIREIASVFLIVHPVANIEEPRVTFEFRKLTNWSRSLPNACDWGGKTVECVRARVTDEVVVWLRVSLDTAVWYYYKLWRDTSCGLL